MRPDRSAWDLLRQLSTEPAEPAWLERILAHNAGSKYLRHFGSPRTRDEFRERVPIVSYEELNDWLDAIVRGEPDVLFAGRPVAYERTGGSTGGAKLIPYSAEGLTDFRRAMLPWLTGIANTWPFSGRVYLATSPVTRQPEAIGGVPVGLSDAAYIGEDAGAALLALSAVPMATAAIADVEQWRKETVRYLSRARDLELISCWSPTFLTGLLDLIDDPVALWPDLKLVSTWTAGASASFARELAVRLPQAHLQPKGLLSTECVVTVPDRRDRPVLTPWGFFEFERDGRVSLASDLVEDNEYEVIATTASGLYRYRTFDLVRCAGYSSDDRPILEFCGRSGHASDLVGEKLTETFVADCLGEVPGFRVLTPALTADRYVLATECGVEANIERIEQLLCRNPQYAYARRLGQLQPVRQLEIEGLLARYTQTAVARGTRLGDVKPIVLQTGSAWLAELGVSP